ncbi:SUMF1/EgtB/PvdO family nonheme iron enzyme [Bacteroidota bacterium]|nr:SUMF1/EgtB/PvdO family nonheme iron enzyme [Bacteroidota bacterium]
MRKILQLFTVALVAFSCGSNGNVNKSKGELVGVKGNKYYAEKPFGMVLVPGGSFIMGKSDDDMPSIQDAPTKTVTVRSFYMDETEITNAEYRQFVRWVRDSVIRTALAEQFRDRDDIGTESEYFKYLYKSEKASKESDNESDWDGKTDLDWDVDLDYFGPTYGNNKSSYSRDSIFFNSDSEYAEVVRRFLFDEDQIFNDMVFSWKVDQFAYENKYSNLSGPNGYLARMEEYKRMAIDELYDQQTGQLIQDDQMQVTDVSQPGSFRQFEIRLATPNGGYGEVEETITINDNYIHERFPSSKRSNFIKQIPVPIYPDTTVWIRDFNYSYNEPMHNDYFWHDAYNDYPVVGVTWHQAKAFCEWRTKTKNNYQKTKKKKSLVPEFRLPTEAEWEFAARGGLQGAMYPWGGPYTKNDRGCFMANFKPMRGDYSVDQALYTVEANAYDPNGYNLFNMAGNVSEWIDSSYEPEAYEFSSTINPNVNDEENELKVVRGGSWKDVKYFLQVSSRDYENADQARSYIGFRTVHDYLGADMTANAMTNASIRKQNNRRSSIK